MNIIKNFCTLVDFSSSSHFLFHIKMSSSDTQLFSTLSESSSTSLYSIPVTSAGMKQQFSTADLVIQECSASINADQIENISPVRAI